MTSAKAAIVTGLVGRGGNFFYNRSVANVSNFNITNVYNRNVSNNFKGNRARFNGMDGVPAAPTHGDLLVARKVPRRRCTVIACRVRRRLSIRSPSGAAQVNSD